MRVLFIATAISLLIAFNAAAGPVANTTAAPKLITDPDRLILSFTGNTLPQGRLEFTAYDFFFWEFGYGVTDWAEIGAQLSPAMLTTALLYSFSVRFQLFSNDSFGLATYTAYTGISTTQTDLVYSNAITQGLAFTYTSRRVQVNLPLAVIATNAGAPPDCNQEIDIGCKYDPGWTAVLLFMPGISVLVAEPDPGERVSINLEFMGAYAPSRSDAWIVMASLAVRWSTDMYLGEIGVTAPIASGYGKPTGDALRYVGWVVPLLNLAIEW